MKRQIDKCIFVNPRTKQCNILDYTCCKNEKCPFFKSEDKYYLDDNRMIQTKDDDHD